jgi:hypothetical protein
MPSCDIIEDYNWETTGTDVEIVDKTIVRAVKDLSDDRKLMATNIPKPDARGVLVR